MKKEIKYYVLIGLLITLISGCGKDVAKDYKPANDKPANNSGEILEKEAELFVDFYNVNEKSFKPGADVIVIDNKLIKSFNLFKGEFKFPKTGESIKRELTVSKDIPIKLFDFGKEKPTGAWYELVPVEDYRQQKFLGYTDEDLKFEKNKIYQLTMEFDVNDGYDILTVENENEYQKNDYVVRGDAYRLNGVPSREVRGPAVGVGDRHMITFYFPKTK